MLAEVLLLLSGHQSNLFIPQPSSPLEPNTYIVSPHLSEYLHPGEITALNKLGDIAFRYNKIKSWAIRIQKQGRQGILSENLASSRKGKQRESSIQDGKEEEEIPNQYLTTLAESLIKILKEYEILIVEIENEILEFNPILIQDNLGYVPLSSIVARFDEWVIPLGSLSSLIDELSINGKHLTPGKLIDLISTKTQTGNPFLQKIYSSILKSLNQLFLNHLITFLLYGISTTSNKPSKILPNLGIDIGFDPLSPKYKIYKLNGDLLPNSINQKIIESILYIGRVTSTLKRENKNLPISLTEGLREEIMSVNGLDELNGLGDAILRARAEVGEWLWKHVLTGPQIIESLEFLSNYFLTRKSDYSTSLLREIVKLRLEKLILSNPNSSSSIIRDQDLNLVLLRSSLNTSAENDKSLDMLKFKMEKGPLRALSKPSSEPKNMDKENDQTHSHTYRLFSSNLLGTPISLTTSITWPLDLFLSPKSLSIYSDMNSYLLALRDTQLKITNTWLLLSNAERNKRNSNKRVESDSNSSQKKLHRLVWSIIRTMNWFLNELLIHFMDIIETQHQNLLKSLDIQTKDKEGLNGSVRGGSLRGSTIGRNSVLPSLRESKGINSREIPVPKSPLSETHTTWEERTVKSNKAPPTPTKAEKNYLDFLTLRSIHSRHLSFLLEALLLSDPSTSTSIRDILNICKRFTGVIERWNGDIIPEIPEDGGEGELGNLIQERIETIQEIDETLHESILEFFTILLDSQNPPSTSNGEGEKSTIDGGKSFSRTSKINQISKMMNRQISFNSSMKIGGGGSNKNQSTFQSKDNTFDSGVIGLGLERHVEQLLLRLDFNGVLAKWRDKEINGEEEGGNGDSVLAQGGL